MKKYLIIVFLLFAGASYAQPVIDSMLIDEMKGELQIFGAFGSVQGKVWVDSVEMPVKTWMDTLVIASIPDTGKGSAGPVIVGAAGYQSAARMLTEWGLKIWYISSILHSLGPEQTIAYFTLYWRLDVHSYLKNTKTLDALNFDGIRSSNTSQGHYTSYYVPQTGQTVSDSTKYVDSAYLYSGYFYPGKHRIDFDITLKVPDVLAAPAGLRGFCYFDSLFKTVSSDSGTAISASAAWRQSNTPLLFAFPPPPKAFALQNDPSIVNPGNHSSGIGTGNTVLRWNKLALMDKYHLDVSLDSLFNSQRSNHPQIQSINTIVDTSIVDTQFTLPPLSKNTKYFWRVAGVNSEGESRWSDVWNFTTGGTASVAETETSPFSFSAYPNPATDKLTISYSASHGDVTIALYDLLGNKVRALRQQAEGTGTELPLTGLPVGMYVLELNSAGIHKSMPISILR